MATFSEQIDSRSSTTDATGARTGQRVWNFDSPDPVSARTLFGSDAGSADWRTFPDDAALKYDRMDVRIASNLAVCIVTVQYSTNASGRLPQTTRQLPIIREWAARRLDVKIPINVRATVVSDDGSTVDVWQQAELGESKTHPERILKVRITGGEDTPFDAISSQIDNVHLINGEAVQLLEGAVTRIDAETWNVVYRYVKDKGTKIQDLPTRVLYVAPDNRAAIGTDPISGVAIENYFRLPFERLTQIQSSDPTVEPHGCVSRRAEYVADGWRSLPGSEFFEVSR